MKYAILPTAEDRRASRRRITSRGARIQTWRFFVTLECGHQASYTRSLARQHEHPKTIECAGCAQQIADERARQLAKKPSQ